MERAASDRFVAASWQRLLRTAYLLAQEEAAAEDLVQTALLKAWLRPRLGSNPEAYVSEAHCKSAYLVAAAALETYGDHHGFTT